MQTNIVLASLGPPQDLVATNLDEYIQSEVKSKHYFFSGLFTPALSRALVREAEGIVSVRISIAALAAEQFRLINGHLPKNLNDLVPRFLQAVPLDPFDGAPLRYKLLTEGYVVYSIGPDGLDDGGKEPRTKRQC